MESNCRYPNFLASLQARCRTHAAALAFVMSEALGSRPAPGTPSAKRSVGTHRAVRPVCMPSEGTARAAQLAPSAVTASAVGGSATRGVVGRVSPTTSGSSRRVLVISRVLRYRRSSVPSVYSISYKRNKKKDDTTASACIVIQAETKAEHWERYLSDT